MKNESKTRKEITLGNRYQYSNGLCESGSSVGTRPASLGGAKIFGILKLSDLGKIRGPVSLGNVEGTLNVSA